MLVDTEIKYRPTKIADLIFPNKEVEEIIKAYSTGEVTRPLILCGKNGTGKSLLAELLPDAIEGFRASVNRIRATDLNSNKEVYAQFSRNKQFDALFTLNGQRYNYNIIEEVNFDPAARDAFRVALDEFRGIDLTIITTNNIDKIDIGVKSRSQVIEVPPLEPEQFLVVAERIIAAEGFVIDSQTLLEVLEAAYDIERDNRNYYKKLDELLR
jgi:DNA polymerase III delta prime subunit